MRQAHDAIYNATSQINPRKGRWSQTCCPEELGPNDALPRPLAPLLHGDVSGWTWRLAEDFVVAVTLRQGPVCLPKRSVQNPKAPQVTSVWTYSDYSVHDIPIEDGKPSIKLAYACPTI